MHEKSTRVLALVPGLQSEKGHCHSFHMAIEEAARTLNWEYIVAAPLNARAENWPSHWQKCLDLARRDSLPGWIARVVERYVRRRSITRCLTTNLLPGHDHIIFIEDPSKRILRALMKSLRDVRSPNVSL